LPTTRPVIRRRRKLPQPGATLLDRGSIESSLHRAYFGVVLCDEARTLSAFVRCSWRPRLGMNDANTETGSHNWLMHHHRYSPDRKMPLTSLRLPRPGLQPLDVFVWALAQQQRQQGDREARLGGRTPQKKIGVMKSRTMRT